MSQLFSSFIGTTWSITEHGSRNHRANFLKQTLQCAPPLCLFDSFGIRYLPSDISNISGRYRRGSCPPVSHCSRAHGCRRNLTNRGWKPTPKLGRKQHKTWQWRYLFSPEYLGNLKKKWSAECCTSTMDNLVDLWVQVTSSSSDSRSILQTVDHSL